MAENEPFGPTGPTGPTGPSGSAGGEEKVSPTWLVLQRMDDLGKRMDGLERGQNKLGEDLRTLERDLGTKMESVHSTSVWWALGTIVTMILTGLGIIVAILFTRP